MYGFKSSCFGIVAFQLDCASSFGGFVRTQTAGPTPRGPDSVGMEGDLVIFISDKFPGDAAAVWGTIL